MESKECTGMLFAFLLGIPSVMGEDYCMFGHVDGKTNAECRLSNGAAVGIIVAIIAVILIAVIIVLCRIKRCTWNMGCFNGCAECG